ncbi:MAG: enoyl-CoA hydratase/isomerase family protein [Chloroflexi bacterium]|nr:enoyl-CoA hydratase/isomerase family protein [Chloroflexota bacterium]
MPDVLVEREGAVLKLTLNRPERLNALSAEMRQALAQTFLDLREDRETRCVVVTGAGRGFCSGADTSNQARRAESGDEALAAPWRRPHPERDLAVLIQQCDVPVIGAINGVAVGWGFGLSMMCDIRYASSEARFAAIWTKRGLPGDGAATWFLPRLVGMSTALELFFRGDLFGADEALRIGLVSRVLPPEELLPATMELAQKVCEGPPLVHAMNKRMVYKHLHQTLEEAAELESVAQDRFYQLEDFREGIRAYTEKRAPQFQGR